jgi:hypothetical protein
MRPHGSDVNVLQIITHIGDQPVLIAADIEDGAPIAPKNWWWQKRPPMSIQQARRDAGLDHRPVWIEHPLDFLV